MDKKELLLHCKAFEDGYVAIALLINDWGRETKALKRTHTAVLDLEDGGNQPAQYYEASAFNYLLSHGLTDTKLLKRIQKVHELFLLPVEQRVLSHLIVHPAYWSFFKVKQVLDDDFFTIEDLLSGDTHQLFSPRLLSLIENPRIKGKHFLTLVYSDGECLHTAGLLRFNALSASDLRFYCSLFAPDGTLLSVINTHYLEFFKLDTIGFVSEPKQGNHTLKQIWQPFTLEEFDITRLGGTWETVELGNQIKYNLIEPDESMSSLPNGELLLSDFLAMEGMLIRDKDTGVMGLSAGTYAGYTLHRALLTRSYPKLLIPKKPSVAISLPLAMLLMDMDIEVPWSHFKKIFFTPALSAKELLYGMEGAQALSQAEREMQDIEDLLHKEYHQAKTDRVPFDQKEFSFRTGASPEEVKSLILAMESYTVPPKDKAFELQGWPAPPQALRRLFSESLVASELFVFDEGPNTLMDFNVLTAGQYNNDYFAMGLLGFIEKLFTDFFTDKTLAHLLANHFFWILFHKGKEWLPVRSYAIELLKLIPGYILMNFFTAEDFISDFSLFTKKRLTTRGICSLAARPKADEVTTGLYVIKGSDAFYSLVEGIRAL